MKVKGHKGGLLAVKDPSGSQMRIFVHSILSLFLNAHVRESERQLLKADLEHIALTTAVSVLYTQT